MRASSLMILAFFVIGSAVAAQSAATAQEPTETRTEAPLPEKIQHPDDPADAPVVTIRKQDNGDRVEEYRTNGRLYMVKVTSPSGISYTMMDTNGDGLLDKSDAKGPVGPVYYTIYRWN